MITTASPFDGLKPEAPPLPVFDALFSLLLPVALVLGGLAVVLFVLGLIPRISAGVRAWFIKTAAFLAAVGLVIGVVVVMLAL